MAETTRARLARALALADAPKAMVARAIDGFYDDFASPLAMPIHQLVADAKAAGLKDIARRAKRGEFDSSQEEAKAWAESAEGKEAFLGLGRRQ